MSIPLYFPLYSRGNTMKATEKLHHLGQSLWLDNITRDLLTTGMLKRYIDELSVTGLMAVIASKSAALAKAS